MLFKQAEARPDDIAGGTVSTGFDVFIDNVEEMSIEVFGAIRASFLRRGVYQFRLMVWGHDRGNMPIDPEAFLLARMGGHGRAGPRHAASIRSAMSMAHSLIA